MSADPHNPSHPTKPQNPAWLKPGTMSPSAPNGAPAGPLDIRQLFQLALDRHA